MILTDLDALLTTLRQHGVTEYSDGTITVTLGSLVSSAPKSPVAIPASDCACGHPIWDHTTNGCLHCGPNKICLTRRG